jgi:hypothetical protein
MLRTLVFNRMESQYKIMAKYGWLDIHYSNPYLPGETPVVDQPNRWTIGVRTGPNQDTICVRHCLTDEDVQKYKSPHGNSINEATQKSKLLYEDTQPGASERTRCRFKRILVEPLKNPNIILGSDANR